MPFSLHAPIFLLMLAAPCILALLQARQPTLAPFRRRLSPFLRFGGLCLLIVAVAQPEWSQGATVVPTVFVADASASISPTGWAEEMAWLRGALEELPPATVSGLVVFAGGMQLISPSLVTHSTSGPPGSIGTTAQTDVEQALRLALGAVPGGGRLVLLSDGLQTRGDALSVVGTARARRVVVDTVAVRAGNSRDAAVTRLQAPQALHPDDALPLLVTVRSTIARRATVTITQDGRQIARSPLHLQAGDNPLLVTLSAPSPGWHTYGASVAMSVDTVPANNVLQSAVRVARRARVLVVGGAAPGRDGLARLVRRFGVDAQQVGPAAIPSAARQIARFDGVILDDIPAGALTPRQVAALDDAVRMRGVGLLLLGGSRSLTLGGYYHTPLERILPVVSAPPGLERKGSIALQLVLDRSGSMDDLAGDVPKIQMAQAAADVAADFAIQHRDGIGIVSFDEAPHVLVPVQQVGPADGARIHRIVHGLTAQGGTNIYSALDAGLRQVLRSRAPYKHIVLMTDGVSEPAHYGPLLALAGHNHVTISTIGLGQNAEVGLLRYLAQAGKGRFYYTANARDLPRIFANEARLSAGPARVLGNIPVALGAPNPVTGSVSGSLPSIHGYVATTLKPGAVPVLVVRRRGSYADPLLALWQYGLGRVATWTPGFNTSWAGAWTSRERSLWLEATHWMLRGVDTPTLMPQLQPDGSSVLIDTLQNAGVFVDLTRLQGTLVTPGGQRRRLAFEEEGPGRYGTALPGSRPGVYRLRVVQATAPYGHVDAELAIPYPQEYLPRPPNLALLRELAQDTGGRPLRAPHDLTATPSFAPLGTELWWPLTALALLLFLAGVFLGLRGEPG